jgi:hypothetical protein
MFKDAAWLEVGPVNSVGLHDTFIYFVLLQVGLVVLSCMDRADIHWLRPLVGGSNVSALGLGVGLPLEPQLAPCEYRFGCAI